MDHRELKGLELAARTRITQEAGIWQVPSQTRKRVKYQVTLKQGQNSCTCDDFSLSNQPCKHIYAARIVRERDHGGDSIAIDTDTLPEKKYKQDWANYNKAQMTESRRFVNLLHDLCRGLEDLPQPKVGRKRTPLADMVFASALKVYTTFSSRRFTGALLDSVEKGLVKKMHPVSVCAFLESELLTPVLQKLIVQSSLPLTSVEKVFAPDSSGFSTSRFVRWYDEKYGVQRSGKDWVKVHVMTGVKTNIVTAVEIAGREAGDSPQFKPLVETTAQGFTIKEVAADKAYLSHENLELVEKLGGTAFVPFKSNSLPGEPGSLWEKMYLYFRFRREEFLKHYHQRSNVESTFSMVKAKFRDHVRSRTDTAMKNEVLCKFLCHNIVVVHQSHIELGIQEVFWKQDPTDKEVILPMAQ